MDGVALSVDDDGVSCVGAAVVSDDGVVLGGEDVDDFALAFVAPLESDDGGGGAGRGGGEGGGVGRGVWVCHRSASLRLGSCVHA